MAGATERKQNSNGNTPSRKGDPDDAGSEVRGKGKPSHTAKPGYGPGGNCVKNSAHGRWK